MKTILKKILGLAGYAPVPISKDPVLHDLLEAYGQIRLRPKDKAFWQHRLSETAAICHLRDLLQSHSIGTVLDIGANVGQFGLRLRKLGFRGEIFSFEPMEQARQTLSAVAEQNGPWSVFPFALGSLARDAELQIFADDSFSSLHQTRKGGNEVFGAMLQTARKEKIRVETLDGMAAKLFPNGLDKGLMIKTDTQGHDLQVLQGGLQTLSQARVILTEAAAETIYQDAPQFTDMVGFLEKQGFVPSGFYPFSHRPESLAMIEFDAFFVRKSTS